MVSKQGGRLLNSPCGAGVALLRHLPQAERTVLYLFGVDKGHSLLQLLAVFIPGFAGCLASTSAMVLLCCGRADMRAGGAA